MDRKRHLAIFSSPFCVLTRSFTRHRQLVRQVTWTRHGRQNLLQLACNESKTTALMNARAASERLRP